MSRWHSEYPGWLKGGIIAIMEEVQRAKGLDRVALCVEVAQKSFQDKKIMKDVMNFISQKSLDPSRLGQATVIWQSILELCHEGYVKNCKFSADLRDHDPYINALRKWSMAAAQGSVGGR